jgi:two-component system sensor histidine kinase DesK
VTARRRRPVARLRRTALEHPADRRLGATHGEILTGRGAALVHGGGVSLIWLLIIPILTADGPVRAIVPLTLLAVFAVGFLVGAPLAGTPRDAARLLPAAALFVFSFAVPWIGWEVRGCGRTSACWSAWPCSAAPHLAAAVAPARRPPRRRRAGRLERGHPLMPAIIISISAMMAAFARNIAAMNELRATRDQMATMAVERERSRVARDLHDILGHSLTVITVKTELAGRLIDVDPERARAEIAEVEQLARGALTDVRATVAGYRGVSISGELAAARAALDAAGIEAQLPGSTDMLPADRRTRGLGRARGRHERHPPRAGVAVPHRADRPQRRDRDDGSDRGDEAAAGSGLVGIRERVEAAAA